MPAFREIALTVSLLSISLAAAAQDAGWQADPALAKRLSERRPGILYEEARVPEYELPDPLKTADGQAVRTPGDWKARRAELLELFRTHMYGRRPGLPDELTFDVAENDPHAMDGAATLKRIIVRSRHEGRSHQFEVILFTPNDRKGPSPVFLLINNRGRDNTDPTREMKSDFWPAEQVIARGYSIAAIQYDELAPDDKERFREGVIRLFEGDVAEDERPDDACAALAAWGWGASRALDYFETDPQVDATKVAVLGHSRGGKSALWAGAEDERFALVISNNSGCGGAALSRRRYGETVERINTNFPHWFCGKFKSYNDREDELPIDQHLLISLIAPRAVYVASADEDLWADPQGEFLSVAHASPVYALWDEFPQALIAPDAMPPLDEPLVAGHRGYHVRSGGHNLTPRDWNWYMDFADTLWPSPNSQ